MRIQRSILTFFITLSIATASQAYVGLKLGAFVSNGNTNYGGGVVVGIPMPVTGLALEAELLGFYDNGTVIDTFFLQTNLGATYDFNSLITPDSDLIHPYLRGGFTYGFLFVSGTNFAGDQSAPGFYTGAGVNFKLPVVILGVEANYNYFNFDSGVSQDYWTWFLSAGIHF